MTVYLIELSHQPLFWSNFDGWVGKQYATHFTAHDVATLRLPAGGQWVIA